jgi:hypothetical protein
VKNAQRLVLSLLATLVFPYVTQAQSLESAPVFKITPVASKVTFYVSQARGNFRQLGCHASLYFDGCFDRCSRYQNPSGQRA